VLSGGWVAELSAIFPTPPVRARARLRRLGAERGLGLGLGFAWIQQLAWLGSVGFGSEVRLRSWGYLDGFRVSLGGAGEVSQGIR